MRKRVPISVSQPYTVVIGTGLLAELPDHIANTEIVVLGDTNTAPFQERVAAAFTAAGRRVTTVQVAPGEDSKTIATWERVLLELSHAGVSRQAALLAVGGGVVGDLGGFVAATYLRGIAFYQVPTSILAMVDSSVGGKTGVNLPTGKNLVGAFWQPRGVYADLTVLHTLPEHEFQAGTAELFKAGLLADYDLATALLRTWHSQAEPHVLADYLARGIAVKANVVAADTFETGSRAYLNLGHTVAHALEAAMQHTIAHGVAVAYGLVFSAALGKSRGWFDYTDLAKEFVSWLGVTHTLPPFTELEPFIDRDKKAGPHGRTYVLLQEKEHPILVHDVTHAEELLAYEALQEVAS